MCIRDSSAPAGPLRRCIRQLRKQRRRSHPSGASGTRFEAMSGPAQFMRQPPQPAFACFQDRRAPDSSAELHGTLDSLGLAHLLYF
eukprot:983014-Alexandrium_andersonii.AAC.1